MIEADARALLEDQTQWESSPPLTSDEVDRLLARARIADTSGRVITDDGYVDTWSEASINRATRQGLMLRMTKAAAEYDVATGGGTSFQRSQKFAMLNSLLKLYGGGISAGGNGIGSIQLQGSYAPRWEV